MPKMLWAVIGLIVVVFAVLAGVLAFDTPAKPQPLASISEPFATIDFSDLPTVRTYAARDGTTLGYRVYEGSGAQVVVLIHGSSDDGTGMHPLAKALRDAGASVYVPVMRGHGDFGRSGDIDYVGQLEDDLADFVAEIRKTNQTAPLTLIGHSSGGGFALRVAGSPIQNLFARTVLLAPYLGYDAPSSRQDAGGWASPDIPRFLGLSILRRLGMICCEALPTIAFAVPPNTSAILASTYSYRLMRNFGSSTNYRDDLAAAGGPVALFAGAADELMQPAKYAEAVGARVPVQLIEGVNHMGIVSDPAAVSAISDDVVKSRGGSR
jgi:alpha-beta hydrolase superfamily lysophospholipase